MSKAGTTLSGYAVMTLTCVEYSLRAFGNSVYGVIILQNDNC
jgi:hypothetical protein